MFLLQASRWSELQNNCAEPTKGEREQIATGPKKPTCSQGVNYRTFCEMPLESERHTQASFGIGNLMEKMCQKRERNVLRHQKQLLVLGNVMVPVQASICDNLGLIFLSLPPVTITCCQRTPCGYLRDAR